MVKGVRSAGNQGSKQLMMTPRAETRKQKEEFTMFGYYDNLPRQRPDHVVKNLT